MLWLITFPGITGLRTNSERIFGMNKKALAGASAFSYGDNWTRTSDPLHVKQVL